MTLTVCGVEPMMEASGFLDYYVKVTEMKSGQIGPPTTAGLGGMFFTSRWVGKLLCYHDMLR